MSPPVRSHLRPGALLRFAVGSRLLRAAAAALLGAALLAGCAAGAGNGDGSTAAPAAAAPARSTPVAVAPAVPVGVLPPGEALQPPAAELRTGQGDGEMEGQLAGPWYRLVPPQPGDALDARLELILFEPEQRRITLFDGDVQEIYLWDAAPRQPGDRIEIRVRNELIHSLERTIEVELVSGTEIRLAIEGGDHHFDGDYRKFGDRDRGLLAESGEVRPGLVDLDLAGRYRDGAGQSIEFEPHRFTWHTGDRQESGAYAVYSVGQPVIVFKVTSVAGVTRELRTYTVDYREQRRGETILHSLVLHPARLGITGVTETGGAALRFERLELLEEVTADDDAAALVLIPPSVEER